MGKRVARGRFRRRQRIRRKRGRGAEWSGGEAFV